jgi:hypothetical protein
MVKRFVVDFGGEEEMPEPEKPPRQVPYPAPPYPGQGYTLPEVLYMIPWDNHDLLVECYNTIHQFTTATLLLVKYKRTGAQYANMFAVGVTHDQMRNTSIRRAIVSAGEQLIGHNHRFIGTIYGETGYEHLIPNYFISRTFSEVGQFRKTDFDYIDVIGTVTHDGVVHPIIEERAGRIDSPARGEFLDMADYISIENQRDLLKRLLMDEYTEPAANEVAINTPDAGLYEAIRARSLRYTDNVLRDWTEFIRDRYFLIQDGEAVEIDPEERTLARILAALPDVDFNHLVGMWILVKEIIEHYINNYGLDLHAAIGIARARVDDPDINITADGLREVIREFLPYIELEDLGHIREYALGHARGRELDDDEGEEGVPIAGADPDNERARNRILDNIMNTIPNQLGIRDQMEKVAYLNVIYDHIEHYIADNYHDLFEEQGIVLTDDEILLPRFENGRRLTIRVRRHLPAFIAVGVAIDRVVLAIRQLLYYLDIDGLNLINWVATNPD